MRKLANFCIRHRRLTVLAWVVALVLAGAAAGSAGENFSNDFKLPDSDSTEALNLLEDRFPSESGDQIQVVFADQSGIESQKAQIQEILTELEGLDHVDSVTPPSARAGSISQSGTVGFATVHLDGLVNDLPIESVQEIANTANDAGTDGLEVEAGGEAVRQAQQDQGSTSEMVGLLAAIVILLITFGSVVAMSLPIVTTIVALGTAISLVTLGTHVIDTADFATALAGMIGLGVGIDYSLFVVTRYRGGLRDGLSVDDSVLLAMDTAGRAVLFAGATVVVAMLGLFAIGVSFLYGPALAASLAVLLTMFAALTLLPAFLSKVGTRIDRLRVPGTKKSKDREAEGRNWTRWSHWIQRRPWVAAAVSTGLLIVLSIPVFSIDLGSADAGTDAPDTSTRKAYDLLADGFGPGFNGSLQVVVESASGSGPVSEQGVDELAAALAEQPGVAKVAPPSPNESGDTSIILVYPTTAPQKNETSDLVRHLRDDVIPPIEEQTGVVAHVGGTTAIYDDFTTYITGKLPLFFGLIILLSALLLMAAFRSILVPLKAIVMNVLTICASFGVVVAIFQWGWLGGLVGLEGKAPIESFLPVMVFAIVFGLSMDYEVFLMSRVHEEWEKRKNASEAVVHGLASTGRVITAAAAIMICVFASFALGSNQTIKLFGVALASAVFIDAFIIRSVLVPAVMELLGKRAWWLPDWLDRILPRLHVDHGSDHAGPAADGTLKPAEERP